MVDMEKARKIWQEAVAIVKKKRDAVCNKLAKVFDGPVRRGRYDHLRFSSAAWKIVVGDILHDHPKSPCYWVTLDYHENKVQIHMSLDSPSADYVWNMIDQIEGSGKHLHQRDEQFAEYDKTGKWDEWKKKSDSDPT